jgi:hypothetical protein
MKFRNPLPRKIELAILGVVALVFTNSAYQLFLGSASKPAAREANRSPAEDGTTSGPMSRGESFETLDLGCITGDQSVTVTSDRVRLKGRWCAAGRGPAAAAPAQFTVESPQAQHKAEAYFEKTWPQFTTEFIPLGNGKNQIRLRLTDSAGSTRDYFVTVQKN